MRDVQHLFLTGSERLGPVVVGLGVSAVETEDLVLLELLVEVFIAELQRVQADPFGVAAVEPHPSESVCPVVFIDAIHVKIRDGQVAVAATAVTVGVGRWTRSDALHHLRVDRLVEEIGRDVRPLGLPPGGPLVGT